jgi:hypothetical protein
VSDDPNETCRVLLVADRQDGTMYHFFRDWRFEAWADDGRSLEHRLFAVAIDPHAFVWSGTRYDMDYLGERPAATDRGTASFAWAAAGRGASDPLAHGSHAAHLRLIEAGWTADAAPSGRYTRGAA